MGRGDEDEVVSAPPGRASEGGLFGGVPGHAFMLSCDARGVETLSRRFPLNSRKRLSLSEALSLSVSDFVLS